MQYIGGKQKIGKHIAKFIQDNYAFNTYIEPFCGVCGVMVHVEAETKVGIDSYKGLIALLKSNSELPDTLTREQYYHMKENKESYPLDIQTFVAHASAFGGDFWKGYSNSVDNGKRNYLKGGRNSILKIKSKIADTRLYSEDYTSAINHIEGTTLIYCDPPYKNTTSPGNRTKFNHEEFWSWVRETSKLCTVLVSELEAPEDFEVVWSKGIRTDMQCGAQKRVRAEKIFKLKQLDI